MWHITYTYTHMHIQTHIRCARTRQQTPTRNVQEHPLRGVKDRASCGGHGISYGMLYYNIASHNTVLEYIVDYNTLNIIICYNTLYNITLYSMIYYNILQYNMVYVYVSGVAWSFEFVSESKGSSILGRGRSQTRQENKGQLDREIRQNGIHKIRVNVTGT